MARVGASGLYGASGNAALERGWIKLRINSAPVNDKGSLEVHASVQEADPQPNGSNPIGKNLVLFFTLSGYETHKDGGTYAKNLLKDFLNAADVEVDSDSTFDNEELIGKEFWGMNRPKANSETGIVQEQFTAFKTA